MHLAARDRAGQLCQHSHFCKIIKIAIMKTLFADSNKQALAMLAGAALSLTVLAGCTTQAQADGSTRVNLSIADALGQKKPAPAGAVAAAPQSVAAQPVRAVAPAPTGVRLSSKTRAVLAQMLACQVFETTEGAVGTELYEKGAWTNEVAQLEQPVMVFGLPVSKIRISGDGSAATFYAYFTGVSKQQMIKAANLKLSKQNKAYYYRDAKAGEISFKHADPEISLKCYIDTEGSYDEVAVPAKKKKQK
jgi:hypothetical protein